MEIIIKENCIKTQNINKGKLPTAKLTRSTGWRL